MTQKSFPWKALLIAAAVAAVNWVFVIRVVGVSYGNYGWLQFAGVYESTPTPTMAAPATATPVPATSTPTPFIEMGTDECSNGIDDNLNGFIDCADPGCINSAPCLKPAPVLDNTGFAIAVVALLVIGSVALMLRRRESY